MSEEKSIPQKMREAIVRGLEFKKKYPAVLESEEELIRYEIDFLIWEEFKKFQEKHKDKPMDEIDMVQFIGQLTGALK